MELTERARALAHAAHAGQTRKGAGQEPYVIHLQEVADLVARFGGTPQVVAAAWLHDTVEDCGTDPADLARDFGADVAAMVMEVTDDKALPKPERKLAQVRNAPHKSPGAALVKICDKLSNIRAVADTPPVHWDKARQAAYLDWAETVVAALPAGADPARPAFAADLARARAAVALR